jgi:hypothetical protein
MPSRRYTCIELADLHTFIPPCLHGCNAFPDLHISVLSPLPTWQSIGPQLPYSYGRLSAATYFGFVR